jgi:hypothetical protein
MEHLQLISVAIGAISAIVVGVGIYFLNQIFLFKNRVFWSSGPSFKGAVPKTTFGKIALDGKEHHVIFSQETFLLNVKGWSPIKNLIIHLESAPSDISIYPQIPVKINVLEGDARITISSINRGYYYIHIFRFSADYRDMAIKGVEADNATTSKREETVRKIEAPFWWTHGIKFQLILWAAILAIAQIYQIVLSIVSRN